jgi:HAD superfamily hydrolase (TIGR01484 family)
MKRLIVFDLDGTLAKSKSKLDAEGAAQLHALLGVVRVAVISGGAWPQFEAQLLSGLPRDERLKNLSLLPTCGTTFRAYDSDWRELYSEDLTAVDKQTITAALERTFADSGFKPERAWGQVIEDRGTQITLSALGQAAPLEVKATWDPDFSKRLKIKAAIDPLLPGFSVRLGGTTSIDVTRAGIDKAYGIRKLRDVLGIPLEQMLFIGDALFEGGNDQPARTTGVACIQVRDPEETQRIIEAIIACLEATGPVRG